MPRQGQRAVARITGRFLDGTLGKFRAFAYAWSLAVVESIIDSGGMSDISRLLDRIATSSSTAEAAWKKPCA